MQTPSLLTLSKLSSRRIRLAVIIGFTLIIVGSLLLLTWLRSLVAAPSDFTQDYRAAQALRAGQSIYSDYNNHPPFDALLFVPLTLLPYDVAIVLWSVMSSLSYLWISRIILHELRINLAGHWIVLGAGLALCWYPFQAHIALGQLSLLVITCIIGSWALLRHQRDWLAGALLGLACLIKLFPGMIILYLLLRQRWRAVGASLVVLVIGWLLTLLIVGSDDLLRYFLQIVPQNATQVGPFPINVSLIGVISRLLVDGLWVRPLIVAPQAASLLIALSGLGLLVLLARQVRRIPTTQHGNDTAFALVCLAMLLVSPLTWQHIFPLLALPFGLLLRNLQRWPDQRNLRLCLLSLASVSLPDIEIARALMQHYAPYRMPWFVALLLLAPTGGLLLLWWMVGAQAPANIRE
jgi:hypothetical protein